MEILKLNPTEFGLNEMTAQNIQDQFKPMLEKMVELEAEFNEVINLPIEDPQTSKKAKELRLKYVKVRTGTETIHKAQKEFYLNGGRFVDGWKNAQKFASQGKETALEKIEKHFENLEKERKEKLHNERISLIIEFVEDTTALNFRDMEQDVFEAYLSTKKQQHFDRIEAEKEAERKRIAEEQAEKERIEAQRLENERLRIENEKKEAELKKQRDEAEAERKRIEQENRKQLEKQQAEANERLRIENEKTQKLQAELAEQKRIEAEKEKSQKQEEERQRKEAEKLAKAPVKQQLLVWMQLFQKPNEKPTHEVATEIEAKFEAFKKWALSQIENI